MKIEKEAVWAQTEFGEAVLGDARRTARLVKCAEALAQAPSGSLPEPLPGWAELKAGYRLLAHPQVTFERIQQPHKERTRDACAQRGAYVLIEDSTQLDFTAHEATEGLGRIGDDGGRGLYVHTTLAARIERWTPERAPVLNVQGLFGQQVWTRDDETRTGRVTRQQRLQGPRESQRWAAVFEQTGGPPPGVRWTYVADRESDIAEVFAKTRAHGVDVIVRAYQPRALEAETGSVFEAVSCAAVKGNFEIALRARPGRPARTARVQVRARAVTVRGPWRPGGRLPAYELNVLEVKELDPPQRCEALHWVLMSTWPCETLDDCLAIVRTYATRWLIEEYHKALKSGTSVEESQLQTAHGLKALLAVLALVAVRLLNWKMAARAEPDKPLDPGQLGPEAFAVLEAKLGKPKTGWTCRDTLVAIARLGGFLARKGDGDPGWITLWRGWRLLLLLSEGYALRTNRCG